MTCCNEIIEATTRITGCECPAAGWCARHGMFKTDYYHSICRTVPAYFNQYEQGIGPGQVFADNGSLENPAPQIGRGAPIGLGDAVAWALAKFGIHPWAGCGCTGRRAWLNRWQVWPVNWPAWPWRKQP